MSYKDYINNMIKEKEEADWQKDSTNEIVKPSYSDSDKDYTVSLKDVINGINDSKYKLSGNNVWLPDSNGDLIPLPEWVGGQGGNVNKIPKQYRIEMISTQGNIIKDKNFTTTLKAILYEDNEDVTDIKDKRYFKWARFSGSSEQDQVADAKWNLKWAEGAKEIPITTDDVNRNAMFQVQFVTEKEAQLWVNEAYKNYMIMIKNKEE